MGRIDRSYQDLKQKQKSAIADKTYSMYIRFYLENHRMPNASEKSSICRKLYATVQALAPKTEYEEFCRIVDKREAGYEERILRDIQNGITLEKTEYEKEKENPRGNQGSCFENEKKTAESKKAVYEETCSRK